MNQIKDKLIVVEGGEGHDYYFEHRDDVEVFGITRNRAGKVLFVGTYKEKNNHIKDVNPILWCEDGSVFTGDARFNLTPYQEIKPCPFCGASGDTVQLKFTDSYHVNCNYMKDGCGATGGKRGSTKDAREAWNKRAK